MHYRSDNGFYVLVLSQWLTLGVPGPEGDVPGPSGCT